MARTIPHAGYSTIITKKKVEDLDIFMVNNIKSGIRDIFGLSNKAVFDEIVLTLYRLNPCRKPEGQRLGGHVYIKRRNCTLWFWRRKNFATSNWLSKTKQRERLMRCILYSRIGFGRFCRFVAERANCIFTLAWGFRRCISVVHSKMIFLICYLLDYQ